MPRSKAQSQVRHWTESIPGDMNHSNRLAETGGVEFFAMPYQPYLSASVNGRYAKVSGHGRVTFSPADEDGNRTYLGMTASATIYEPCDPPGNSKAVGFESFCCETTIEAINLSMEWAVKQLHREPRSPI